MPRLAATARWFDSIVVAQKLCPFASAVRNPPKLRLKLLAGRTEDALAAEVAAEAASICSDGAAHETALLVVDAPLADGALRDWSAFYSLSWRLQAEALVDQQLQDQLQLVLFHPRAVRSAYSSLMDDDAADFAVRSPFPTIHLLRERDVMAALKAYPDAEGIPQRNAARLRDQGAEACARRLEAVYEVT